jgi:hypothetical protein
MQISFVSASAHLLGLHAAELHQQPLLIFLSERSLGKREKDVVFLVDVLAEHGNVAFCMTDELCDRGGITGSGRGNVFIHSAEVSPAQLVLVKHHSDWSALAGNPLGFQGGKQVILLFSVMAMVGKVAEEGDGLVGGRPIEAARRPGPPHHRFEAIQYLLDDAVFVTQDFRGFHKQTPG